MRSAWMFLTPMILVLAAVAGWPLLRTIYFGFTNTSLSDFENQQWVGFDNYFSVLTLPSGKEVYDGLFADPVWWAAVWNTIRFTVISVFCETVFGLVVALVLNASFKGRGLVRAAILIPWAIPTIVSAKMWAWMLNDQFGIINDILLRLHLISAKIAWTADPDTAMAAVLMVDIWKTTPFMALLMVAVIFRALDAFRIFDLIYVLTPNNVQTKSMSVYAKENLFDFDRFALGSAASTALFVILATFTILYMWLGRVDLSGGR